MFRYALITLLVFAMSVPETHAQPQETVVLLHGLIRSSRSMNKMERALRDAGYRTCNIDYPSRTATIEELSRDYVLPEINACAGDGPLHVVTHSMGGIVLRYLATSGQVEHLERVVMLGPPNQGSEVVDRVGGLWLFQKINGPAGRQLGTDDQSLPLQLGPATFHLGVIAGTRSINWLNSRMIDGEDDGKVSVDRARLEGMADFLEVPSTHTFMMRSNSVIRQTLLFLETGAFEHRPDA